MSPGLPLTASRTCLLQRSNIFLFPPFPKMKWLIFSLTRRASRYSGRPRRRRPPRSRPRRRPPRSRPRRRPPRRRRLPRRNKGFSRPVVNDIQIKFITRTAAICFDHRADTTPIRRTTSGFKIETTPLPELSIYSILSVMTRSCLIKYICSDHFVPSSQTCTP